MGSLFPFILILLSLGSPALVKAEAQEIKSARLLDLVLRDYTIRSYNGTRSRTGMLHAVHLPANFSDIRLDTVRFRCGSLRRYGAQVKEFKLEIGVKVSPCLERVIVIRQNLGNSLSSVYYESYNLSGYQLVSPVLGLLAYNAGHKRNNTNPFELRILAGKTPIKVDFSNTTRVQGQGTVPLCATFGRDGKVTLANQTSPYVCVTSQHGHFGLVMESPSELQEGKKMSWWKVAMGASIGAVLGTFLLGLLLVAMFAKVKKRSRMEELERRAYEEEALQVSMVGHIRAPIAAVTRTTPSLQDEYTPPPP